MNAYYSTFNTDNTIACRNNGTEIEAHGRGLYTGVAVAMIIDVLEVRDGFELRKASNMNNGEVKFRLFWDGECISTLTNEREARHLLNDFAPAPAKKRGRKPKAA